MVRIFVVMAVLLGAPMAAQAQDDRAQTLADIRQELTVLYVEVQKLNRELSTTGGAGAVANQASLLDRANAMEAALQRLTSKTEELEFRIGRIVSDGTVRIRDLEFRLCELESDCDLSQLGEGTTLGGEVSAQAGSTTVGQLQEQPDVQMAVGEEADFRQAEDALAAGNYGEAAALFETFRNTYTGGPLSDQAGVMLGDAREGAGDIVGAARAYLDVFSANPEGTQAPDALFNLGRTLGRLGKTDEACVTLADVELRYPGSNAVLEAQSAMRNLGCS